MKVRNVPSYLIGLTNRLDYMNATAICQDSINGAQVVGVLRLLQSHVSGVPRPESL